MTDKLYETGCCLCGWPDATPIKTGPGAGYKTCIECDGKYNDRSAPFGCGKEIARRKSPPAADRMPDDVKYLLAQARHHVSDAVVTRDGDGLLVVWTHSVEHGWILEKDGRFTSTDAKELLADEGGYDRAELRQSIDANKAWPRADAERMVNGESPASRPSLPEAQFYGVQPAELPETLPAGTVFVAITGQRIPCKREARLVVGMFSHRDWYSSLWSDLVETSVNAKRIDWSTVPRQATHPPAPEREVIKQTVDILIDAMPSRPAEAELCPCGAVATHPDPHMADGGDVPNEFCGPCFVAEERRLVRECDEANARGMKHHDKTIRSIRIAALTASPDPLDRLAAKRSAHVEAHRLGFDVPARVRRAAIGQSAPCVMVRTEKLVKWTDGHPRHWPSNEGED